MPGINLSLIAVKKHQDQGISYKRKHLIVAGLVSEIYFIIIRVGHAGKHDAGEGTESSTS